MPLDVVSFAAATQAQVSAKKRTSNQQMFGQLPAPVCAGRAIKPGSFSALTGVTFQSVTLMLTSPPQIRVVFPLFGLPGSNNLTPEQLGGPLTIKASVIWNYNNGSGGTEVPLTFSGVRSYTTISGALFAVSDPVDVPVGQNAGTSFVVRVYVTQSPRSVSDLVTNGTTTITSATANFIAADINAAVSGTNIPGGATLAAIISTTQATLTSAATGSGSGGSLTITPKYLPLTSMPAPPSDTAVIPSGWNGEGYLSGDYTDQAGNSWGGGTNDGVSQYLPVVCGWSPNGAIAGAVIGGDSIAAGTGWSSESGSFSYLSWALYEANIGAINLAHSGEQLLTVLASYNNQRARFGAGFGIPNYISEWGTNDLFTASQTAAQLKANMLTLWADLATRGFTVFQTTLLPQTNSTDSWQTVTNQSSKNSGAETYRQTINQWLRAPASAGSGNSALYDASGTLAGVFDGDLAVEVNSSGSSITINASTGAISNGSGGFWHCESNTYATGTASATTSTTLTDSSKSWTTNQWLDYAMVITSDSVTPGSVGQVRFIAANNATRLSTDTAWTTTPSTSATYALIKVFTIDGTHPSTFGHKLAATEINTAQLVTL